MMLKRGLSMSATLCQQSVKTPVQVHGVEGRYASALYTAAHKQKSLDNAEKDLQKFKDLYKTNKQFKVSSIRGGIFIYETFRNSSWTPH